MKFYTSLALKTYLVGDILMAVLWEMFLNLNLKSLKLRISVAVCWTGSHIHRKEFTRSLKCVLSIRALYSSFKIEGCTRMDLFSRSLLRESH